MSQRGWGDFLLQLEMILNAANASFEPGQSFIQLVRQCGHHPGSWSNAHF
jgi:hypothetical protein